MASKFTVTGEVQTPDWEAERRYLVAERDYAERQIEASHGRWRPLSYPGLGLLRAEDWRHYLRDLDGYEHKLEKYDHDIQKGWIPFTVSVSNDGRHAASRVHVRVEVENGRINTVRKAPKRPVRIDAPAKVHKEWRGIFSLFQGFSRHRVEIKTHSLEAELSRIEPKEAVLAVNQVLHLASGPKTRVTYTVSEKENSSTNSQESLLHFNL